MTTREWVEGSTIVANKLRRGLISGGRRRGNASDRSVAADRQFHAADDPASPDRLARLREALIGPLREVYPSRLFPDASLCKNAMAKKGQVGGEPWRPSPPAALL